MPYDSFEDGKPVSADNGLDVIDGIRKNLMAARDAVVMGVMEGWNLLTVDDSETPSALTWSKGAERLRATLAWGISGGEDGNVTVAIWAYSSDSGSNYDNIGIETVSYYASGRVSGVTWS